MMMPKVLRPLHSGLVPLPDSCEQARGLLTKYTREIEHAKKFPLDEGVADPNDAIEFFLQKFPNDTLRQFRGHGVNKGSEMEILGAFLNILANKTIVGETGSLEQGPHEFIRAYTNSSFLVISHFGRDLIDLRQSARPQFNPAGVKVDVAAHVINGGYYPLIDELHSMYPGANIIRAN